MLLANDSKSFQQNKITMSCLSLRLEPSKACLVKMNIHCRDVAAAKVLSDDNSFPKFPGSFCQMTIPSQNFRGAFVR
ncbi:MAG: hypothetical protein LBC81_01655 [Tannerellaceae bacterium]|jgi:hypothetical protein|nr:hypothetical protein [Tannerellaceae bacterium]